MTGAEGTLAYFKPYCGTLATMMGPQPLTEPTHYIHTDQHEQAGQQEVDEVPQQGREPEVGEVDPADLLHMLGLH